MSDRLGQETSAAIAPRMLRSMLAPETCIVFVSYGRQELAERSYSSLAGALAPYRGRVRVIISDATDDPAKREWACATDADDVILTPRFTPAATSRNLAVSLALDKYTMRYVCFLEDDFEYDLDWYPKMVSVANRLYGAPSPFGLAYGIFSASDHHVRQELCRVDETHGVVAYLFGAVAYQRFMPIGHYLAVMRGWDADVLGVSYAQTGGQTFRNVMRGFCGAILPGRLCWPIDSEGVESTWSMGKRHPGPPPHSFRLEDYQEICSAAESRRFYEDDLPR